MVNKRGISAIVATVLIILITVAAVTIIWVAIIPMIQERFGFEDPKVRLDVSTSGGYTVYDNDTKQILIQVKRGADEAELSGIKITLNFEGESYYEIVEPAPDPNQQMTYDFDLSDYDGPPTSVSISPIYIEGNQEIEGAAGSDVEVPLGPIVDPPEDSDPFGKICIEGETKDSSCGIGACASTGTKTCIDGQWDDDCVAGTPAPSETCDNSIDDDCDGDTDENCEVCSPGDENPCTGPADQCIIDYTEKCTDGTFDVCTPNYALGASCDGGMGTCLGDGSCSALPIASIFRNCIAYWPFDEESWDGTPYEVEDLRNVYGVDGTVYGGLTTSTDAKYGRAATFGTAGQYIAIPELAELGDDEGQEVTISAWVKWTGPSFNYDPIVTQSDDSYNGYYLYVDGRGNDAEGIYGCPSATTGLSFSPISNDGAADCSDFPQGVWKFVVGTRNVTHFNVYVDGVHKGSNELASPGLGRAAHIGYDAYTANPSYFNGVIDEVMIFNYSLTPSEVLILYGTDFDTFKA